MAANCITKPLRFLSGSTSKLQQTTLLYSNFCLGSLMICGFLCTHVNKAVLKGGLPAVIFVKQ